LSYCCTALCAGIAEDWNALSGYYYEGNNNTIDRFLPEPFGCNDTSVPGAEQL